MHTSLSLTTLSLAAMLSIALFTACSQKPSSAEIAAQVKVAVEQAEKDKQTAASQTELTSPLQAEPTVAPVAAPAPKPVKKHTTTKHAQAEAKPFVYEQERTVQPAESTKPFCANCGIVLAVNATEEEGKGSGIGVVAGGVVGGLLGNQVGQGTGNDLATIAGVVGGAFAGNKIEKITKKTKVYHITVKMDDGSEHSYRQATDPELLKGQKVKIENNVVVKN